jgi:hypothetical protein
LLPYHGLKDTLKGEEKSTPHIFNDIAHALAYSFLHRDNNYYNPSRTVINPPSSDVAILYDNSTLTSNMSSVLKDCLYKDSLKATICKTENWTPEIFQQIDWQSCAAALSCISHCQRISICKLSHKLLNRNYQSNKYYNSSDVCPCCLLQAETLTHMLTCQSLTVIENRSIQLQDMKTKLHEISTPDSLIDAIIHRISTWEQVQISQTIIQ